MLIPRICLSQVYPNPHTYRSHTSPPNAQLATLLVSPNRPRYPGPGYHSLRVTHARLRICRLLSQWPASDSEYACMGEATLPRQGGGQGPASLRGSDQPRVGRSPNGQSGRPHRTCKRQPFATQSTQASAWPGHKPEEALEGDGAPSRAEAGAPSEAEGPAPAEPGTGAGTP